ncbi:hypothetical protein V9T40_003047 [Parthenolecanium corni]|uniref:PSI domain-containing protein n=1 Tax=Parthenolecanium corni TaxID=536013 RepID=A0AAN9Y7N2_9HEMI
MLLHLKIIFAWLGIASYLSFLVVSYTSETAKLISINSITPKQLPRNATTTFDLNIDNLPPQTGQFLCVFTIFDTVLTSNGTHMDSIFKCRTPTSDLLPYLPDGMDYITAKLSVKINDLEYGHTNITFFDCSIYTSCTSCVSSNFPCDWLSKAYRCTYNATKSKLDDLIFTGIKSGPKFPRGPQYCPAFRAKNDGLSEILVAQGSEKEISVALHPIVPEGGFIHPTHILRCEFGIEGRITTVEAKSLHFHDDEITCDPMKFSYSQHVPNMTATLSVTLRGSRPLENPNNIHVLIYKCQEMAKNCSMCLALDKKFGCGWCQSKNSCEFSEQCNNFSGGRLSQNDTCPNHSNLEIFDEDIATSACKAYTSCTSCVSSNFPCDWLSKAYRCTYNATKSKSDDLIFTGIKSGPKFPRGPQYCPAFRAKNDGLSEILVAQGSEKEISVALHPIVPEGGFIHPTHILRCEFGIEGRITTVEAKSLHFHDDEITCDPMKFSYSQHVPNMTATLSVTLRGSRPLENPNNIHVLIYKCQEMAKNCSMCLALDKKFGCGWCQSKNSCEFSEQCNNFSGGRLSQNDTCPNHSNLEIFDEDIATSACKAYTSCTSCVSSNFPCDWLSKAYRCTYNATKSKSDDLIFTGIKSGPKFPRGPQYCPAFRAKNDGLSEILVAQGSEKEISVALHPIVPEGGFIHPTHILRCEFGIEGRITTVEAKSLHFHDDEITCDPMKFSYSQHVPNMTATLSVTLRGSRPLENPNNIHVLIYKCQEMAKNCSMCLALDKKFGCGWCQSKNSCEFSEQCNNFSGGMLSQNDTCPNHSNLEIFDEDIATSACKAYTSCTSCVSSNFPCDWLSKAYRCTYNATKSKSDDLIFTGIKSGPKFPRGPQYCPAFRAKNDGLSEILVAQGSEKEISVALHPIVPEGGFIHPTHILRCEFGIEGRITTVEAKSLHFHDDEITCDPMKFSYSQHVPNMTATLSVTLRGSRPLENPNNIHVLIYKCQEMAKNCSMCLALDKKFGCGWCQSKNSCEFSEQCNNFSGGRLSQNDTCPNHSNLEIFDEDIATSACKAYTSCTSCVSSNFPCDWLSKAYRCTYNATKSKSDDLIFTGIKSGPKFPRGPQYCPAFRAKNDGLSEILVAQGSEKEISVALHPIVPEGGFIHPTHILRCEFGIEGRITTVEAKSLHFHDDEITCDPMKFSYSQHVPNMTATLSVTLRGSRPLENPNNIHVLIYKCQEMAKNCSMCLALDKKFGCGWCQSKNSCEFSEQCNNFSGGRLSQNDTCPNHSNLEIFDEDIATSACKAYTSCTSCVSSNFPCDWLSKAYRCTYNATKSKSDDLIFTGIKSGPKFPRGPQYCPAFRAKNDGLSEILVAQGSEKEISVALHPIVPEGGFIHPTHILRCEFGIEGRITTVEAKSLHFHDDEITCDPMKFSYSQHVPNMTATLSVTLRGSRPLENPNNIHVLIYKCQEMAKNCSMCLALDKKFGCGWCQSKNSCEFSEQCNNFSGGMLSQNDTCPNPYIV